MVFPENPDIRSLGELLDALEQLDKRIRGVADEARRLSRIVSTLREEEGFFARYVTQFAEQLKVIKQTDSPAEIDTETSNQQGPAAKAAQYGD